MVVGAKVRETLLDGPIFLAEHPNGGRGTHWFFQAKILKKYIRFIMAFKFFFQIFFADFENFNASISKGR